MILFFGLTESCFLIASLGKLLTGGIVTLLLTLLMLASMLSWNRAEEIEKRFSCRLPMRNYLPLLKELRSDGRYRKLADHLVYLDDNADAGTVDQAILYSLLDRGPKRAGAYWFVTVNTVSEPNLQRYQVETYGTDCVFRLRLDLGYKCSRPLTRYLREALLDMQRQGLVPLQGKSYHFSEESALGTFHYCVLRRRPSGMEDFSMVERWALRLRDIVQGLAGLREEWYTEADTDVEIEWLPLTLEEEHPVERIRRLARREPVSASHNDGKSDQAERLD
jgi:KUP system potassium uptake protein